MNLPKYSSENYAIAGTILSHFLVWNTGVQRMKGRQSVQGEENDVTGKGSCVSIAKGWSLDITFIQRSSGELQDVTTDRRRDSDI